jgi:hypothetical protein
MICKIISTKERNNCTCCLCQTDKSVKYRFLDRNYNQYDVCNKCYFEFINNSRSFSEHIIPTQIDSETVSFEIEMVEDEIMDAYENGYLD